MRVSSTIALICIVFCVLALLPGRTDIAPQVESDYCYSLLAAERFAQGKGLTTLDPVAPGQPWEYRADFVFLTRWPIGYPLLVWLVRMLAECTTLSAASWLAVASCAAAFVGWLTWARRMLRGGVVSILAAVVVASCSISPGALINPRTDTLVTAAVPWLLLLMNARRSGIRGDSSVGADVIIGVLTGLLFWIRYAALFLPVGILLAILIGCASVRTKLKQAAGFAAGCAVPVLAILVINRAFGPDNSMQVQLNLGHEMRMDFNARLLAMAWWRLTDFGFYDYRPEAHVMFACAPVALAVTGLARRVWRRRSGSACGEWEWPTTSSLCIIAVLMMELVLATALFGRKYDYVSLDRYYEPVRPLLLALCLAAVIRWLRGKGAIPESSVTSDDKNRSQASNPAAESVEWSACLWTWMLRAGMAVVGLALIVALHWNVTMAWERPYQRWRTTRIDRGPTGAWAQAFCPNSNLLYEHLRRIDGPDAAVFSNFHDLLAWETGLPAYPVPKDRDTARRWLKRMAEVRGVDAMRAYVALDPSHRWRDRYLPPVSHMVDGLGLELVAGTDKDGWRLYRLDTGG